MKRIFKWFNALSKRRHDSISGSVAVIGMVSTVLSILGISLGDLNGINIWLRIAIVIAAFAIISVTIYMLIGKLFSDSVSMNIRNTSVDICHGDIFQTSGWKVIGCDTHFDTRIDDIVISKNSLHGQLVLNHGKEEEIKAAVEAEANRLHLVQDSNGLYDFPLGSIVCYHSSLDNQTYLLLAMTELNEQYESHTNMAKYELMLMKMWREVDRVYASNDIVLPVLGDGISRFDDGPKDSKALLKCMLCTLNSSGISLNSKIKIVIYGNSDDIALYEYMNMFHYN